MDRIVNISHSFKDAENWDIKRQTSRTHEERQKAASLLKKKFYGTKNPDVRESRKVKIIQP